MPGPKRSPEERAAALQAKIDVIRTAIAALEEKKTEAIKNYDTKISTNENRITALEKQQKDILNPKPKKRRKTKKQQFGEIAQQAMKSGMSVQEFRERLGMDTPTENNEAAEGQSQE